MDFPQGLGEGVPGVGGVRLRGSSGCGLARGLGLGAGGDAVHQYLNVAYAPRLAADVLNPPTPMISDHVGGHSHVLPATCIPPSPTVCQQLQIGNAVPPPPFLTSEEKTLNWAILDISYSRGQEPLVPSSPPAFPAASAMPLDPPRPQTHGLVLVGPLLIHPHPLLCPKML